MPTLSAPHVGLPLNQRTDAVNVVAIVASKWRGIAGAPTERGRGVVRLAVHAGADP